MKKKEKKQELVEQNYILAENVSFIRIDDIFFSNKIVMCVLSHSVVSDSLCDPMDYSPPGSSVHGIFQARILKLLAISYSRGSS